jgi:Tol biopolymer transport system component
VSWSPDGHHILVNTRNSIKVFDVSTRKITKEIKSSCPIWHGGPVWSPNSKWFYRSDFGTGYYYIWVCMNGLDGTSWQAMDGVISEPVWDKTGDYLYFIAGKMDLNIGANWFTSQRLMLYNVKTRKSEELLSFAEDGPMGYPPIIFLSPSEQKLGLYMYAYHENNSHYVDTSRPKKCTFTIVDIQSLSIKKFNIETDVQDQIFAPDWSPDSNKIIFNNGFFYFLDIKTGKFSLFSGKHTIERAIVSPIATTP